MQMTAFQKVIFCLLFLPGYILVFLGSFTRTKGDIRKAQKQYKEIHFYGPFYSMLIYILLLVIFWPWPFVWFPPHKVICIKTEIPKEICEIDDELKAIYHSQDTVCIWIFRSREDRNNFMNDTVGMKKEEREKHYSDNYG